MYDYKDNWVLITTKKHLLNRTIIKNQTDLISQPYGMVMDITGRDIYGRGQKRKTRIVNICNSMLRERQTCRDKAKKPGYGKL